jgi:hypothetical protein
VNGKSDTVASDLDISEKTTTDKISGIRRVSGLGIVLGSVLLDGRDGGPYEGAAVIGRRGEYIEP